MKLRQRIALRAVAAAAIALTCHAILRAHDIPDEIVLHSYVKPEGNRLQVLLRIPLIAIADANLPKDGPGYLAMRYLDPALQEAANQISNGIVFFEEDERLLNHALGGARISLPSDRSFASYDAALRRVRGAKLPDNTQIYYNQGFLDLELQYPIRSPHSRFSMRVLFGRGLANRTATVATFIRPDGSVREFRMHDDTSLVRLDPRVHEAAGVFVTAGFYRFLYAVDALLFVVLLAVPYRRTIDLAKPIVAFAMGHSITFAVGALQSTPTETWLAPAVGAVTALSVVYLAIDNAIRRADGLSAPRGDNLRHRWVVAIVFGLAHGFGFAVALGETLQFAGAHRWVAIASYNLGIELGTLIVLAIVVPAFNVLFTQVLSERAGIIVSSIIIGHVGWHWMMERFAVAQMTWPGADLNLVLTLVRWLLALTVAGGIAWFLGGVLRKKPENDTPEKSIVDSR